MELRHFGWEDANVLQKQLYPEQTTDDVRQMIDDWNTCEYQGHAFEMFAVTVNERIVGSASLYGRTRSIASLGIEILDGERNKGFAAAAMQKLLELAAKQGYRVILDQVRADNSASIRLHEALGFETDGYPYRNRRDHTVLLYLKLLPDPSSCGRAAALSDIRSTN